MRNQEHLPSDARSTGPASRPAAARARLRTQGALLAAGLGTVVALAPASHANAQTSPSVIKPVEPNLMVVLDTSFIMGDAMDGSSLRATSCSASGKKTRWAALAEVLTGKLNNLDCGMVQAGAPGRPERWVPLSSNRCYPVANDHPDTLTGLAGDPSRWPYALGGGVELYRRSPIVYKMDYACRNNQDRCELGSTSGNSDTCEPGVSGQWDQLDDGLIDTFETQVRFGLATTDALQIAFDPACADGSSAPTVANNWTHEAGPFGTGFAETFGPRLPAWRNTGSSWGGTNPGSGLQLWRQWHLTLASSSPPADVAPYYWWNDSYAGSSFPRAFSYWYQDAGNNWMTGGRSYSADTISPLCTHDPPVVCTLDSDCAVAPNCTATTCFCSSARNPVNPAQHVCQKRMAAIPDTADIGIRNSDAPPWMGRLIGFDPTLAETNVQRAAHNDMVQWAVTAAGPYESSAPLGAMLRDAHEFITEDVASEGAYLPNTTPVKIGPQLDATFTGPNACREAHIVLVSQGEASQDLTLGPAFYAGEMFADEIKTFVVGVGLSTMPFDANLDGVLDAGEEAFDCTTLVEDDLLDDRPCQIDATTGLFRFADVDPFKDQLTPSQRTAIRQCCTLLDTAVSGGTERPYFARNQADLKNNLATLFGFIAGGTLSRTVPIFAPVTSNFVAQNASSNAPSVFFELRSSLEVVGSSPLWLGHLERVRYLCDGDLVPERQTIEADKGDVFEANLEANATRKRRFFTVVPNDHHDLRGSLRPNNPTAWCPTCGLDPDNFDGAGTETYTRLGGLGNDQLLEINALASEIESLTGGDLDEVVGVSSGDVNACRTALGSTISNDNDCARHVLRWWGGDPNACKNADCEARARVAAEGGSPLGALYRSNPIIVQPPSPDVADQTYANVRSDPSDPDTTSFVAQQATRPTMLYAQSVDGQLHAFTMAKNLFDGTSPYDVGVSDGDLKENNELWSFVPPIVLPSLWDNFYTHARLLDGPVTAGNVVYKRSLTQLAEGTAKWSTVLIGSGGVSQLGAYYYALDVTNPLEPRFLWQLSRMGDEKLFGDYASGAALTHLVIQESGSPVVVAVAVLPGGMPKTVPSGAGDHVNRSWDVGTWAGIDYRPRSRIRDWGDRQPARSLTFVEVATGRILTRLHGRYRDTWQDGDDDDDDDLDASRVEDVDFDSPISGTPAAFPFATGEPARQIYVGDSEGTMWRVNVTDTNPDNWTTSIAWDAYSRDGTTNAYDSSWVANGASYGESVTTALGGKPSVNQAAMRGQPVQLQPLISLDERGVPMIMYSTGDQEGFTTKTPGMVTMVTSFTDEINASGQWSPRINDGPLPAGATNRGVQIAFVDGARATGPLSLYDGQLIMSFFDPTTTGTGCATGSGGICAFRYNERDKAQSPAEPIPFIDLNLDGDIDELDICDTREDEYVFGVAINQVPSCAGANTTFGDPWLAGSYSAASASNSAGYQLVMHTGEGGTAEDGGLTNTTRVALPLPRIAARVNSWVSALE